MSTILEHRSIATPNPTPAPEADQPAPLTRGLARNTLFNVLGWLWPTLLALVSVPFIVKGLGTEAFGVFGIVSIVAGYLGLLNGPMAFGNVRFMAEAYGRRDWTEFFRYVFAGLWVSAGLAGLGALILFLIASPLARVVFKIPNDLVPTATLAFQMAAVSFFFNGVAGALQGILSALRRYDLQNVVSLTVGTLNTVGIVVAIWLGGGLLGAVVAQLLSSLLAAAMFGIVVRGLLHTLLPPAVRLVPDWQSTKRLVTYSAYLFGNQLISTVGLQLDRTLIGIVLGVSAVTFYTVPAKITDNLGGLAGRMAMALYPLSAESQATGRMEHLRELYMDITRLSIWVIGLPGIFLIICAHDILRLWVGPELADKSWFVLILLTVIAIARAPSGVAFQVNNGLGKVQYNLWVSMILLPCVAVPLIVLLPRYGLNGAALAMTVVACTVAFMYEIITQRRFLGQKNWWICISPYARMIFVAGLSAGAFSIFPLEVKSWWILFFKLILFAPLYLILSMLIGLLQRRELSYAIQKTKGLSLWRAMVPFNSLRK